MHIPDGFLSVPVWATLDAVSVPAVGLMARHARRDAAARGVEDRQIPLLGVLGAFVFAAQMINFPVGLGTSGHLVGGTLLAVTLGPAAACLVMTAILAIQAFVFQDGGVIVLGVNIFNMAIAGVLAGYLPYRLLSGAGVAGSQERPWRSYGIFLGGVLSVLTSACLALAQLLISGVPMPPKLLWVSLGLFAISAVLEGAITLAAVSAIERLNPRWVRFEDESGGSPARSPVLGLITVAAILMAVVGIVFASASPDGIEALAAQLGLAQHTPAWLQSPLADYQMSAFVSSSMWLRKAGAGVAGLTLIYLICALVGRALTRRAAKGSA